MRTTGKSQLVVGMILAWAVIYLVHVFIFPVYETNAKHSSIAGSPLAALEAALCGSHRAAPSSRVVRHRPRCPPAGIVTAWPGGRTGNLISSYASLWAVSRRTGLEAYAPPCLLSPLTDLFANLSVPSLARVRHCRARWNSLVHDLDSWNNSLQAIVLPAHTVLLESFLKYLEPLRTELRIAKIWEERAQSVLTNVMLAAQRTERPVFVGVHVRRTDYHNYLRRKLNVQPAPISFYVDAMAEFERRFPDALFVVVSDDPKWCKEAFAQEEDERVQVVDLWKYLGFISEYDDENQRRAYIDLAVLAACNHSIFDYGTFGLWGALLAGGQTIVYNVSPRREAVRLAHTMPGWSLLPPHPPVHPPIPPVAFHSVSV